MLPTHNPKSHRPRTTTPYARKQAMKRSGSFLGTIKNIVSAPFSWFASSDEEDLNGKRKRVGSSSQIDDGEEAEVAQKSKKMRVDSPERIANGYLDPLESTFKSSIAASTSTTTVPASRRSLAGLSMRSRVSALPAPLTGLGRTMSEDPFTSQFTAHRPERPLPVVANDNIRYSMPLTAHDREQPPPTPFRLRTSLTPQVSPAKGTRREASAPPPLSTLESKPKFVKPPPAEKPQNKPLSSQKTMSLGSYVEFQRLSRSPTRERMLSGVGSMTSTQSDVTIASAASTSVAGKAFHELEMFKRPIIPSRYKGAKSIPEFLKPKKVHVPIPLPRKDRVVKPSLGMADKVKTTSKTKHEGKPYAGQGGMSRLLAKRKAEVDDDSNVNGFCEEDAMDDSMEADTSYITDVSEVEEPTKQAASTLAMLREDDPFSRPPAGRDQPFGRIGRIRQSRREPSVRSSKFARDSADRQSNKFSAAFTFDDEEAEDGTMDTAENEAAAENEARPKFSAPEGFSFANTTAQIQHDHSSAKEPPIPSLPFSLAKPPTVDFQTKQTETSTDKRPVAPLFAGTSFGKPPGQTQEASTSSTSTFSASSQSTQRPAPLQPPSVPSTSAFSFAAPPVPAATSTTTPANPPATTSSGVPNFFANSALLANASKTSLVPQVPSTPLFSAPTTLSESTTTSKPIKDPENPLWNGDDGSKKSETFGTAPTSTMQPSFNIFAPKPETERPKSTEPKPSPFGFNRPSAWAPAQNKEEGVGASSVQNGTATGSLSLFGTTLTKPAEGTATTGFGATNGSANANAPAPAASTGLGTTAETAGGLFSATTAKPIETVKLPTISAPMFSFGQPAGAASKENIAPVVSDKAVASTSIATQPETTVEAPKSSFFTFNAPPSINGAAPTAKPATTVDTKFAFGAPAASTSTTEAAKNPFAFGAPPATPPGAGAEPKPFSFGAPAATSSTSFSFGTPPTTAATSSSTPAASTTPFSFGVSASTRQTTPPNKDKEESMEESPTRMDENGKSTSKAAPNPFFSSSLSTGFSSGAGTTSGAPMFTFGVSAVSNPFAAKTEQAKPPTTAPASTTTPFTGFGRTASAPVLTTSFSFGQKSDGATTPTSAFGAPPNPFAPTPVTPTAVVAPAAPASTGFPFGASTPAAAPNPFAPSTSQVGSAPSSPFQSHPTFSFTAATPPVASSNSFQFGASQPSSPANSTTGLPQSPSLGSTNTAPVFTFGAGGGDASAASGGSIGGNLFNIGAAPPQPASGAPRAIRRLPRRGTTGAKR